MATACSKGLAGLLLFFCKRYDSPEAGGDQQASTTWAAGGLQMAETNGAGMERKDVERSLRSEALECNEGEISEAFLQERVGCHEQKPGESNRHDRLVPKGNPQGGAAYFIP